MPYLTGGTLAERVARHGPAPVAEVERLADQLGGALAAAHRAGVVHRDIKPANVLFDADGEPHLADFGVASSRDDTAGLTAVGTVRSEEHTSELQSPMRISYTRFRFEQT